MRKLSAQRYFQYLMFVFHTKLDIVSLCFCSLESCVLNANKKLLMFFLYFRKKIWTKFNFHWHIISNFWRFVGTIFLFVFQLVTMNLKQKNTKILDRFYNNMNYEQQNVIKIEFHYNYIKYTIFFHQVNDCIFQLQSYHHLSTWLVTYGSYPSIKVFVIVSKCADRLFMSQKYFDNKKVTPTERSQNLYNTRD